MKIAIINTTRRKYGGAAYERMLAEVLSNNFEVEFINIGFRSKGRLKYLEAPLVLQRLFQISKREDFDIIIRNLEASFLFLNKKPTKNIALIHHIDYSQQPFILRVILRLLEKMALKNLRKFDAIIVVSTYWENFFKQRNCTNVYKIYNSFNIKEFSFNQKEIDDFKKKNNLSERPVIYIGNAQKKKGVVESHNALKDLNAYLVTSGKPQVEIPAVNLELDRRDYLRLLKASSVVVTMSKFKEGWCRTAHEAMLSRTPVVGSGCGGMGELLEEGGQIICQDFEKLRDKVNFALNHSELGEAGYKFAQNFTVEDFKRNWLNFLHSLKILLCMFLCL